MRRLTIQARDSETERARRQSAALAVVMSVTAVEVFLNVWFRIRVEEKFSKAEVETFLTAFSHPRPWSLDKKLREWPNKYLGRPLGFEHGAGAKFMELKRIRNSIVHFTSTHTSIDIQGLSIVGAAAITPYRNLGFEEARASLFVAEDLVIEIFTLAGMSETDMPHLLHLWLGKQF